MKTYKITIPQLDSQEFIINANSSDEAIDIVKNQIKILEISGDIEVIEE
jgi:hypothetical protein